jgi:predicted permease
MESVLQDLKYALRTLGRAPAFTAAAVLAIALGVGGSSAMFSVLESVVLRPLAVPDPDRLMRLYETSRSGERGPWSIPDFLDLSNESSSFDAVAGLRQWRSSLTTSAGPQQIPAAKVTQGFFAALGVHPALGRGFTREEDEEGGAAVAVLTDGLWRREFGGDHRIVGQSVALDGSSYTVVGVMPARFSFPLLGPAEVLLPLQPGKFDLNSRGLHGLAAFGRVKRGLTLQQAQADLDVIGPRIASRLPEHNGQTIRATPLLDDLVGPVKPILQALLGAVILVLLIACANVASMLLARGAARQRELAIRAALGSGRRRIVRQLLTESLLLALAGGVLGVLLAAWGVDGLVALAPRTIPRLEEVKLDGTVLTFALLISLASGVLAGVVPAVQASRPDVVEALKNGAAAITARSRARGALVVAEVALALVLVVGAGLMIRTLVRLLDVRTGMAADPAHVLVAEINLPRHKYDKHESLVAFDHRLLERVAALPGVQAAALSTGVPLDPQFHAAFAFEIEGESRPAPEELPEADVVWASPGYPETLGVPVVQGRSLTPGDTPTSPNVVLVNQAFVRKHLRGREALGRRLLNLRSSDDKGWTIVGVIEDVRAQRLDQVTQPLVLVPRSQWPMPFMRVLLRTAGSPLALAPLLRAEVLAIDKDQPLANVRTLEGVISESLGERKFQMMLLTAFGAIALALASVGIYGVVAYSVAQRAREIGIRMALGAQGSSVLRMVVASGLRLAALGVAIGLMGAFALTQALRKALYQISATDPLTFAAVSALLLVIAVLASWAPARRATRVDPVVSLRAE